MTPLIWMRRAFRELRAQRYTYQRQVWAHIQRSSLEYNLHVFQRLCKDVSVAPVLKSNAYGHGLVHVARILDSEKCPFFVIDGYHEALILRNEGIRTPLVVMGITPPQNILRSRLRDVAFMVGDMEQIQTLADHPGGRCRLHLKVNTGLHRHGIEPTDLAAAMERIADSSGLDVEGICSHFTDVADSEFTDTQVAAWNQLVAPYQDRVRYVHIVNTAGTAKMSQTIGNVARIGLGCYGYDTHPHRNLSLRPALSVYSYLRAFRNIQPGEHVGYGRTWQAESPSKIALVPTGYHTCVDARLSNKGSFHVGGYICPIVGRICMNTTMINVSQMPEVQRDQVVEIIGTDPRAANSIRTIARLCQTTPHIIFSGLSPHMKRVTV